VERESTSAGIRTSRRPVLSKPANAECSLLFQEVLHTICSPNGQVLRIVIFRKNGIQAMVEYPLVQGLYWNVVLRQNVCSCKTGSLKCSSFVKIMILAVRNHRSTCQTRWLEAAHRGALKSILMSHVVQRLIDLILLVAACSHGIRIRTAGDVSKCIMSLHHHHHYHHHHLVLLLLVEHMASMKSLQALRSPSVPLTSLYDLSVFLISSSVVLRHVLFDLSLLYP